MKAILSIILLLGLSACVSYPYTMLDDGQGVYYQNPADAWGAGDSVTYVDVQYYPYWSIDYFYLGAGYPAPWYDFYYSPYFYPHYFAILYPPWYWGSGYGHPGYGYGYYSVWHDPYWHNRYRHHQFAAYPAQRRPSTRPGEFGSLGDSSRVSSAEPTEAYQPGMRRTSFGSPGITSTGSMIVVSPSDGKVKQSRVGPTRGTGVSARVSPNQSSATVTPQGRTVAPAASSPRSSSPQPSTIGSGRPGSSSKSSGRRSSSVERRRSSAPRPRLDRDRD